MKNVRLVLGYLALVCVAVFAVFKIQHWPGANVAAIAGAVLFSILYAPFLFAERLNQADTLLKKIFHLIVLVTMAFFGIAFLVHVMHWPGRIAVSCIAYSFMVLTILLQIYRAFTEDGAHDSQDRHNLGIVSAIVLILVVFMEITTIPKAVVNEFDQNIATQRLEIQYFTNKTEALFENLDKTNSLPAIVDYMNKAEAVRAQSDSLVSYIRSLGESMMFLADEKKISFDSTENLCRKANANVAVTFMMDQNNDSVYQSKRMAYREFMAENTNSRGKEILDLFFVKQDSSDTQDCTPGNCCSPCYCKPVISVLMDLHADILHIRMLESETINYLQTMQAKIPRQ